MSEIRPMVICSLLIERNSKFLLVLCPKFKKWRVPGGKVDGNETLEQTVVREMKEELNIEIENPSFIGWGQDSDLNHNSGKNRPRLLMFFHVKYSAEITPNPEEAEDYKWVTLREMKKEKIEGGLFDFFRRNPNFST